ncbi:hypothetical protein EI94DRAFT_1751185 [Lactarius quietus]|nr:hypothetical protein EI94DRAFT_1751185 [Lactarius quietus]
MTRSLRLVTGSEGGVVRSSKHMSSHLTEKCIGVFVCGPADAYRRTLAHVDGGHQGGVRMVLLCRIANEPVPMITTRTPPKINIQNRVPCSMRQNPDLGDVPCGARRIATPAPRHRGFYRPRKQDEVELAGEGFGRGEASRARAQGTSKEEAKGGDGVMGCLRLAKEPAQAVLEINN